jgi:hypothetical protein
MDAAQLQADTDIRQSSILRRYMDLPKLLDLLSTNTLYCRRADGFADRLEGALFPSFRKSLNEAFARGDVPNDADYFYRRSRMGSYVSCWTLGARDNMALWQLYGGGEDFDRRHHNGGPTNTMRARLESTHDPAQSAVRRPSARKDLRHGSLH